MKFVDLSYKQFKTTDIARCLKARYTAAPKNHTCEDSGVLIGGKMEIKVVGNKNPSGHGQGGVVYDAEGIIGALNVANTTAPNVAIRTVLTPDREEKRQNGRRMKDEGEPMFTLTAQDRHGVAIIDDQGRANKKLTPSDICPTLRAQSHGNEPKVIDAIYNSREPRVSDTCPTLRSERTGLLVKGDVRIRRLTPREVWRLQGFPDEYFDKAKYKKEKIYFVGGEDICCAKLRAATEKPKLFDTETYALCTTKDMLDMEMSTMMENPSKNEHCNEQILNVNIVMIKSENMAHLECAANIIKCIDFMGMRCTMIKSQEAQTRTDIIVSARGQKENTVKYMRITTMCSLPLDKLYTILTLLKLIIELKIFTSTTLEANMQGFMRYTTDLEGNILLKVSNLEMEHIMQRTSDSALYKMAGNAVTVNVARAIGLKLKEIENE